MKKYTIIGLFAREMGLHLIKDIIKDGAFELKYVVTHFFEPDMNTQRKLFKNYANLCNKYGIPLIVVDKNQNNLKILKELKFDFLISNCYKYIIPTDFLNLAKIGSYNMHRSLLYKYPGLKPLKRALLAGEKETGTTIHEMNGKVDSGKIILQSKIKIYEGDNEFKLFKRLYPTQYPLMKQAINEVTK